jgi:G3E family GTPase
LTDQVEFANVIIINKIDLVSEDNLEELRAIISSLNPEALLLNANESKVGLENVLNTGLFDYEKAEASAGWLKEIENEHVPETEEFGISSFVLRSKRPFHPERFLNYLNQGFPQNVIRSKGLFWLASRSNQALLWSSAGSSCKADSAGVGWASMPLSERTSYTAFIENKDEIESDWSSQFGDRKIELVFIGQHLNKDKMISDLEDCILTAPEVRLWEKQLFTKQDLWPLNY